MLIGVLALQGAFIEHIRVMRKLGIECREIRQPSDWTGELGGLIIPGGESTVISKLLSELGLMEPIRQSIARGLPVFGTCAGLILMAEKVIENDELETLGCLNITARRNAFGRQLGSFYTMAQFADYDNIPMTFIRAPYIESAGAGVDILSVVDGRIVAARRDNMLVTAFHPELSDDTTIHNYFLSMINERPVLADEPMRNAADKQAPVVQ